MPPTTHQQHQHPTSHPQQSGHPTIRPQTKHKPHQRKTGTWPKEAEPNEPQNRPENHSMPPRATVPPANIKKTVTKLLGANSTYHPAIKEMPARHKIQSPGAPAPITQRSSTTQTHNLIHPKIYHPICKYPVFTPRWKILWKNNLLLSEVLESPLMFSGAIEMK